MANPVTELSESIEKLNHNLDRLAFWINPANWVKEGWAWLDHIIGGGRLDIPFMATSIVLVWLIMLGAEWPKKVLFWGWIIFWTLRGFIF